MKVPTVRRVKRYASVIMRWVLIGTGVFGFTMATGYYITNDVLPEVYTASTVLQLPASDLATPTGSSVPPMALQPEFVSTMMSPELLLAVIKELDLEKGWAKRLYKTDVEDLPDVDALTHIEKLVKVQIKRETNMVEITAASDLPQEAAAIANAVATHYQSLRDLQIVNTVIARQNHVRIIERAVVPTEPTKPNKGVAFLITFAAACVLSLLAASFVEMILLFVRAGERPEN